MRKVRAADSILRGLNQAVEYEKGNIRARRRKVRVTPIPQYTADDIKRIRESLNLTQSVLASFLGTSVKTVEAWEARRNIPQGPAKRMLQLMDQKPNIIKDYINDNPL